MIEEVEPEIAADGHEGIGRDPAGEPPQQVVPGDERQQEPYSPPQREIAGLSQTQYVDEVLDGVLRADRATDRAEHGKEHEQVARQPSADIMQEKDAGTVRRIAR